MVYSNAVTTVSPTYANEVLNGGAAGWLRSTLLRPEIKSKVGCRGLLLYQYCNEKSEHDKNSTAVCVFCIMSWRRCWLAQEYIAQTQRCRASWGMSCLAVWGCVRYWISMQPSLQ